MNHEHTDRYPRQPAGIGQWGKLTDDELDVVEGRRELLVGKLQAILGISREEADRRYEEFERSNFGLACPDQDLIRPRAT